MRRPTTRDGVIVPRVTLVALLTAVVGGVGVSHGWSEGWWLLGGGAVGLVTAVLVAWRLLYGALIASPLWVVFVSLVVAALPGEVVPGSVAGWIAAAGVLLAASIGLVGWGRS